MAQYSDKINVIDQCAYQILKNGNSDSSPKILRSAKYRNKHKKAQCTLLDFLVVPRQKQNRIKTKRRPHLIISKSSITLQPKRKGKTRLYPKRRITRLKRIIQKYRTLKREKNDSNIDTAPLHETLKLVSTVSDSECNSSHQHQLRMDLQKLSIIEVGERTGIENCSSVLTPLRCGEQSNPLEVSTEISELCLKEPYSKEHKIHSRRFRSYCDNCTTLRLKDLTSQLLNNLGRFQKRAFINNEVKARAHPRLVVGFHESLSRLRINKVKLIILAPDCEICPGTGGLNEMIELLKLTCQQQNVPYCFSLMRRELSYALHKRAQISCIAILDYDGANEIFKDLIQELNVAVHQYKTLIAS